MVTQGPQNEDHIPGMAEHCLHDPPDFIFPQPIPLLCSSHPASGPLHLLLLFLEVIPFSLEWPAAALHPDLCSHIPWSRRNCLFSHPVSSFPKPLSASVVNYVVYS